MSLVIRDNLETRKDEFRQDTINQYLLVETGESAYALSIADVEHVFSVREISIDRVKAQYKPLVGFLTWKEQAVPVLDLASHLASAATTEVELDAAWSLRHGSVLLVNIEGTLVGLLVSRILGMERIASESTELFPEGLLASPRPLYVSTFLLDDRVCAVLRLSAVVTSAIASYLSDSTEDYRSRK